MDSEIASRPARVRAVWLAIVALGGALALVAFQRGPGLDRQIARLASALELRPGMVVAEVGAGNGRMAVHVARQVGPSGRVFATEIKAEKLQAIRRVAADAGLINVTLIEGDEYATGLPQCCCDLIYMRRVYHHLSDPVAINKSVYAALRPGGRLLIIDLLLRLLFYRHGIASEIIVRQATEAGFVLERPVSRCSLIDYYLVLKRPERRSSSN